MDFSGKRVIVTGSTRGIGRETARQRQYEPEGQFGGGMAGRGRAANQHAPALRRGNIDGGVAHAGGDDQPQLR